MPSSQVAADHPVGCVDASADLLDVLRLEHEAQPTALREPVERPHATLEHPLAQPDLLVERGGPTVEVCELDGGRRTVGVLGLERAGPGARAQRDEAAEDDVTHGQHP